MPRSGNIVDVCAIQKIPRFVIFLQRFPGGLYFFLARGFEAGEHNAYPGLDFHVREQGVADQSVCRPADMFLIGLDFSDERRVAAAIQRFGVKPHVQELLLELACDDVTCVRLFCPMREGAFSPKSFPAAGPKHQHRNQAGGGNPSRTLSHFSHRDTDSSRALHIFATWGRSEHVSGAGDFAWI